MKMQSVFKLLKVGLKKMKNMDLIDIKEYNKYKIHKKYYDICQKLVI